MPVTTPQAIGQSLAKLGRVAGAAGEADDGARSSREVIFDLVQHSAAPLTIEQICRLSGLHANTVRAHLEVLHAAGRVTREQHTPKGRGRPPWLFSVAPGARSARAELAETLLDQLAEASVPGLAQAAAERWAAAHHRDAARSTPATSPDEGVRQAATALEDLGFDARVDSVGDRIEIRDCPYAGLVAQRPLICDIHAALLGELLAETHQPVTLRRLDVWSRRGLCIAHLTRPDLTPARSVEGASAIADHPDADRHREVVGASGDRDLDTTADTAGPATPDPTEEPRA